MSLEIREVIKTIVFWCVVVAIILILPGGAIIYWGFVSLIFWASLVAILSSPSGKRGSMLGMLGLSLIGFLLLIEFFKRF